MPLCTSCGGNFLLGKGYILGGSQRQERPTGVCHCESEAEDCQAPPPPAEWRWTCRRTSCSRGIGNTTADGAALRLKRQKNTLTARRARNKEKSGDLICNIYRHKQDAHKIHVAVMIGMQSKTVPYCPTSGRMAQRNGTQLILVKLGKMYHILIRRTGRYIYS